MSSSLTPLNDGILVKIDEVSDTTPGGIVLPEQSKDAPQRGEVVAVGPGPRAANGQRCKMDVQAGDRVLFQKFGGTKVQPDGKDGDEFILLKEIDVIAKET